jgi:hypothetical protein
MSPQGTCIVPSVRGLKLLVYFLVYEALRYWYSRYRFPSASPYDIHLRIANYDFENAADVAAGIELEVQAPEVLLI